MENANLSEQDSNSQAAAKSNDSSIAANSFKKTSRLSAINAESLNSKSFTSADESHGKENLLMNNRKKGRKEIGAGNMNMQYTEDSKTDTSSAEIQIKKPRRGKKNANKTTNLQAVLNESQHETAKDAEIAIEPEESQKNACENENTTQETITKPEVKKVAKRKSRGTKEVTVTKKKVSTSVRKSSTIPIDANTENIVLEFFKAQNNRPHGVNDLVLTFKNHGTKVGILKLLADMAESNKIMVQSFGNKILYYAQIEEVVLCDEEIKEIEMQLETEKMQNLKLVENVSKLENEYAELTRYPSNADMLAGTCKMKNAYEQNEKKMEDLSEGRRMVSKEDMVGINKELNIYKKMLKERKILYKNVFEMLLDGTGLTKAEFMEELGMDE